MDHNHSQSFKKKNPKLSNECCEMRTVNGVTILVNVSKISVVWKTVGIMMGHLPAVNQNCNAKAYKKHSGYAATTKNCDLQNNSTPHLYNNKPMTDAVRQKEHSTFWNEGIEKPWEPCCQMRHQHRMHNDHYLQYTHETIRIVVPKYRCKRIDLCCTKSKIWWISIVYARDMIKTINGLLLIPELSTRVLWKL